MTPGPSYLSLPVEELERRARSAVELLAGCRVCPRACGADRTRGELGACRTGRVAVVASAGPHHGEERPISGRRGSGTIFFSGCNLECVFCQNHTISQMDEGEPAPAGSPGGSGADERSEEPPTPTRPARPEGEPVDAAHLARLFLAMQSAGCHNVNLVSPTHVVPQILEALAVAVPMGLSVPIVYNSGGYDAVGVLRLLDGIVDIYMPDFKYGGKQEGLRFSGVRCYPGTARDAVREMHRQVGDLALDADGVATRGLLVRHLVLPCDLSGTADVMRFLASLSVDTYVNVMAQYRPCFRAGEFARDGLARCPTREEMEVARKMATDAGLRRLDRRG